jgi:K+-transporting ATPase KdpF subunit
MEAMAMEVWLAGIATIGLTFYLLFALVRPERF